MSAVTQRLAMELHSLKVVMDNLGPSNLSIEAATAGKLHIKDLEHIQMFAKRASEVLNELEAAGLVPKQKRASDPLTTSVTESVLGSTAEVVFPAFNKTITGKVDTGATTSSIDAHDIKIHGTSVTFKSPHLSNNSITLNVVGSQNVQSADGGDSPRPMVKFDINIGNDTLKDVTFNLNDRAHMDTPILLGQNVITAGKFIVDISKGEESKRLGEDVSTNLSTSVDESTAIINSLLFLRDHDVSLRDIYQYLRTDIVNTLKE